MVGAAGPDPMERFPCGCMVTDLERRIRFANAYFEHRFGLDRNALSGRSFAELLTNASSVILENYVLPMVMHEGECEEIQMTMITASDERVPVVVNAALRVEESAIYWSIAGAVQRDRLSEELLEARRAVEARAEQLKALSLTDGLTGLVNRHEMEPRANVLIKDARRAGRSISMLVMDIDDFKAINDRYGHAQGDGVLRAIGRCLTENGRETDLIARFGGDEFVMLLPGLSVVDARRCAVRIDELLRAIRVDGVSIQFSIGVAGVDDAGAVEFEQLFSMADRALYRAKAQGKNRIAVQSDAPGADTA